MKPIEFPEQTGVYAKDPEQTGVYAKDQPEYIPLPVYKNDEGQLISCWQLTWKERFKILFVGKLWLSVLTFHKPLQPLLPQVEYPFIKTKSITKSVMSLFKKEENK